MRNKASFQISTLSAAIASTLISGYATAQQSALEEVIVTATRRAESIQDIPINITALGSDLIERERLSNLSDIAKRVPGMTLVDQGPRSGNALTVRGLSVDSLNAPELGFTNSGGDTVGTYVGEIPLYIDLRLRDMDRVEVLIGPQGTLYGAGTLGGAVRYIPNKPQADALTFQLRGDVYDLSESDDVGYETGGTLNIPIIEDKLAVRASLDYEDDPGFIDYNYLVREAGVSNPQPDFSNPDDVAANLKQKDDVNTDETWSGRIAARYTGERLDSTLSYYYQQSDIGGRQINHKESFGTDDYESAHRFEEPTDRENQLIALELVVDLGFAELVSATGYSNYDEEGSRDQTDLLLDLGYGYELFPSFSGFTRDEFEQDRYNQELRLVSTGDSKLNWIVGAFYNKLETDQLDREYTPGFDEFAVAELGGVALRPDSLEYYFSLDEETEETAVFGEIGYQITDDWQVTLGARYFEYDTEVETGVATPLLDTVFYDVPADSINTFDDSSDGDDSDSTFKFNTSYYITDDVMTYFTYSEGYRLGGSNAVAPCPDDIRDAQIVCALPNEVDYTTDETTNYELGIHSTWGDNLIVNGSLYYIEWDDIQIGSVTNNGSQPITSNGDGARSQGVELSFQWYVLPDLSLMGSYAYTDAELTDDALCLLDSYIDDNDNLDLQACAADPLDLDVNGYDGDRLPGSPEHQGFLAANYGMDLGGGSRVELDYSLTTTSDVLTKVGERNFGESLDGYTLHNVSATWLKDNLRMTLYADNLFDEYAETGVRLDQSYIRQVEGWDLRRYYHNVVRPRQVGLRVVYDFDGL